MKLKRSLDLLWLHPFYFDYIITDALLERLRVRYSEYRMYSKGNEERAW